MTAKIEVDLSELCDLRDAIRWANDHNPDPGTDHALDYIMRLIIQARKELGKL